MTRSGQRPDSSYLEVVSPHESSLDRLRSIAGPSLGTGAKSFDGVPNELAAWLSVSNGFYVFESALHVYPSEPAAMGTMTAQMWNDPNLWRSGYGSMAEEMFFFAEDVFGGQFAMRNGEVLTLDPETGATETLASSLAEWAECVLDDFEFLTGYPLAHAWQERHGPLAVNERLVPKQLFVLGGEYSVDNLYALDAVEGMRLRADVAMQLADLPDGTSVTLKIIE